MSKIATFRGHTYITPAMLDYLAQLEKGMSGDVTLVVTPATCGSSATAVAAAITSDEKFQRKVKVELQDGDGNIHTWFNGSFDVAATKSSTSGVVAIEGGLTKVQLVEGVGEITINYTGTWAAADTCTLTLTGKTLGGVATGNKTSVDTLVS